MTEKFIEGISQQFSSIVNNLPTGAEMPGQEQLKSLLSKGGTLILETLVVDGDGQTCLVPKGRYAQRHVQGRQGLVGKDAGPLRLHQANRGRRR